MKVPTQVSDLLDKEMDRKEFLKHVGIASLVVLGAGTIIRSLEGVFGASGSSKGMALGDTYGASVYGGVASLGEKQ